MGFWIFMLCCNLLIPGIMLGAGKLFLRAAPKEINSLLGYRTTRSMKNMETWNFAHTHCGRLWVRISFILLPVVVVPMLCCIGKSEEVIGLVGTVILFLCLAVLILSIFPTERALRRTFDEHGNRIG